MSLADGVYLVSIILILLFGFVTLRGAPYLRTLKKQRETALKLLDLHPGQVMLELGSGDGAMLRAAAEKGIRSVGYELNPLLVVWTRLRHWRYRSLITVKWGDFWRMEWPESDGMYVFLLQRYMPKLHNKITHYNRKYVYYVVSNSFAFTDMKPIKRQNGLFLYSFKTDQPSKHS